EVIDWTVASSESGGLANGARDVLLRQPDCLEQRSTKGELRNDGGGERAACAVRAAASDALAADIVKLVAVEEKVGDIRRGERTAFDDHRGSPQRCERSRRC